MTTTVQSNLWHSNTVIIWCNKHLIWTVISLRGSLTVEDESFGLVWAPTAARYTVSNTCELLEVVKKGTKPLISFP